MLDDRLSCFPCVFKATMSFFSVSQSDSVLSRLWSLVRRLRGQVHELRGRIRGLEAELAEVRERLQRNSGNSSRPPSSDGPGRHRRPRKGKWYHGPPCGARPPLLDARALEGGPSVATHGASRPCHFIDRRQRWAHSRGNDRRVRRATLPGNLERLTAPSASLLCRPTPVHVSHQRLDLAPIQLKLRHDHRTRHCTPPLSRILDLRGQVVHGEGAAHERRPEICEPKLNILVVLQLRVTG